jgi:single-strand DNA-binding protein
MAKNRVELIGNIGQEPTRKDFDNGGAIVTFSLGTTDRAFTTKDGKEIPEKTEWHKIVVTGGLVNVATQYFHKGDKLYIEGKLRNREYNLNGEKRITTEVVMTGFEFMQARKKQEDTPQQTPTSIPDVPTDLFDPPF